MAFWTKSPVIGAPTNVKTNYLQGTAKFLEVKRAYESCLQFGGVPVMGFGQGQCLVREAWKPYYHETVSDDGRGRARHAAGMGTTEDSMRTTIAAPSHMLAVALALAGCAPAAMQPSWNVSDADRARCRYEARAATAAMPNAFLAAQERRSLEEACIEAAHMRATETAAASLTSPAATTWAAEVTAAAETLADAPRCGVTPDQNGLAMRNRSGQLRQRAAELGLPAVEVERLVNAMPIQAAQMVRDGRARPTAERCTAVRPAVLRWAGSAP